MVAAAAILVAAPTWATTVPVNFLEPGAEWKSDGADISVWTFNSTNAPNDSATQGSNSPTLALFSGQNDLGARFEGSISVDTGADDDFIGFVLGYNDNDIRTPGTSPANSSIDYVLIDWRQGDQANATKGMALSRVTGDIWSVGNNNSATTSDAWTHSGVVSEEARAATLGSTGWADNTSYDFKIDYSATSLIVEIDGVEQFNIAPGDVGLSTFTAGSFGFYGFSQEDVRYSALTRTDLTGPPAVVPLPAGLPLAMAGLGALVVLRRRRKVA